MQRSADVVFIGGSLFTAPWDASRPGGIAVRDGRILAVGSDDEVRAFADTETHLVDLAGGLL
ncbi:MAG: amidohydrolase, partial [Nocardioidaceae bacterium]|nr:amidohydrolase [Nocardioidaceae bacterium]